MHRHACVMNMLGAILRSLLFEEVSETIWARVGINYNIKSGLQPDLTINLDVKDGEIDHI